jgi:hypothetical protein
VKAIETRGRVLPDGRIELDAPVDVPVGEVRLVILFPEHSQQEARPVRSSQKRGRIVSVIDRVASLSVKEGPPVSNRDHDRYLYGA